MIGIDACTVEAQVIQFHVVGYWPDQVGVHQAVSQIPCVLPSDLAVPELVDVPFPLPTPEATLRRDVFAHDFVKG
jgi:hypothetical protein